MLVDQIPILNQLSPELRTTVVRILLAILVLALIWLLRRALTWMLVRPLRWLARRTPYTLDDLLIEAMIAPTRILVIALSIIVSAAILEADPGISLFLQRLARSLVIIAAFAAAAGMVNILTPSSSRLFAITGMTVQERLLPFMRTAAKIIIGAMALVIIIQEWGYDVSGLIAGLGLGGLAVSLAAKDTVENLFGFSAIVGDSPFVVGEFIKTPDVEGIVERVGARSTRIRQLDQALVTVPNSKLAQSAVLNWSRLGKRRYDTLISIPYGTGSADVRLLLQRIRDLLQANEHVEKESIVVHLINFGESGLEILIRAYLLLPDWVQFTAEKESIHLAVMDTIEQMGLAIAFPSRSIYVEHMPGVSSQAQVGAPDTPIRDDR